MMNWQERVQKLLRSDVRDLASTKPSKGKLVIFDDSAVDLKNFAATYKLLGFEVVSVLVGPSALCLGGTGTGKIFNRKASLPVQNEQSSLKYADYIVSDKDGVKRALLDIQPDLLLTDGRMKLAPAIEKGEVIIEVARQVFPEIPKVLHSQKIKSRQVYLNELPEQFARQGYVSASKKSGSALQCFEVLSPGLRQR